MKLGLQFLGCIYKTKSMKSYSSCALCTDQSWFNIKDEWIEETVSLIIMSVILSIKSNLYWKHIRLCVFRNLSSNSVITNLLTFDKDPILGISKSDPEIAAIVLRALEILSNDVNSFVVGTLDRSISRSD
jgi:hypothetical protein